MGRTSLPKRIALTAAACGAVAAITAAPAMAAVPGENIFAAGSSLQKVIQQNVWTPTWTSNPLDHPTLSNSPTATYTSESSGFGLNEFGNNTGSLDLTQDPTANSGSTNGYGVPVLDGYVGTDDPPTGPLGTAGTQLTNAQSAATGGAATKVNELTVPVAQAPVAILISLPTGVTVGTGTKIQLTNAELQQIWDANVAASAHYAANTWGAVLEGANLKLVTGTPAKNQFSDNGSSTGGAQAVTLQVRSSGSGTSYTFKGFLNLSGDANYSSAYVTDDPTWPVTVSTSGPLGSSTGGSTLVGNTTETPGSVSYANLADAALSTFGGYTNTVQTTSNGGTHQIAYALIQSNQGGATPIYADPQSTTVGTPNVYTGNNIDINGTNPSFVGHWNVPFNGTAFNPTGSWGGTLADDPNVYTHASNHNYYPIVAATYDLAWTDYDLAGSNLVNDYGGSAAQATAAGNTVSSFLKYVVTGTKGQANLASAKDYYAKLPAKIDTYAGQAASKITP